MIHSKLLHMFLNADDFNKSDGMAWYFNEHDWLKSVAQTFGLDFKTVCAVCSALSPATSWPLNKRALLNVIHDGMDGKVTTYQQNKLKALRLLDGADIETELNKPSSMKTWNFFNNLYNPQSSDFVTIDRHMARAFDVDTIKLGVTMYRNMAETIKDCAGIVKAIPHQVQAVIWNEVRTDLGLVA